MEDENRRSYLEHRAFLVRTAADEVNKFDKTLFSFSSAAIILSVSFIDNIAKIGIGNANLLLIASWISFSLTIVLILASHKTSYHDHMLEIAKLDSSQEKFIDVKFASNKWRSATLFLNALSFFIFVSGIFFLGLFGTFALL